MKCENCGRNEANFIYRSSINGRTEEHHLCQACAEKLGYTQRFFSKRPSMLDSFFGNDAFFGSTPSLMGRMLESPFDDFFDTMPAIGAAPVQEVQEEKKDNLMSHEDQNRFSYLRQMNALKHAQEKAIAEEDFERAAQLRDEIHKLEEALQLAQEAAGELGHGYMGTEHLLLGLMREDEGLAHTVLTEAGLTDDLLTEMIRKSAGMAKTPR